MTNKERREEIEFFMSIKLPPDQICAALNLSPETLSKWCYRNGYNDLGAKLELLHVREAKFKERNRKKKSNV